MSKEEIIELFYPLITEAIRRAETLDDLDAPGAAAAYLDVSLLEEKIAEALPASDPEGALARRGAVRAAITSGNSERARQLVEKFLAADDAEPQLRSELQQFAKQLEEATKARFPHAVAKYGLQEIQRIAQAFARQQAPFPIG